MNHIKKEKYLFYFYALMAICLLLIVFAGNFAMWISHEKIIYIIFMAIGAMIFFIATLSVTALFLYHFFKRKYNWLYKNETSNTDSSK